MSQGDPGPRVIVALDYASAAEALAFAQRLDPARCRVKVGKELFTVAGPALVEQLVKRGFGLFLDLKYHDIPNTVASACRSAANLGVWMMRQRKFLGKGEALDAMWQAKTRYRSPESNPLVQENWVSSPSQSPCCAVISRPLFCRFTST